MASYTRDMDGIPWPNFFPEETFYIMRDLQVRDNDIILDTYPKCGTNWLAYVIWGIVHPEEPAPDGKTITEDFVFGDLKGLGRWSESPEDQGRMFSTHFPFDKLPNNESAKYVVVLRNPMDCCVSFYHFAKGFPGSNYKEDEGQEVPSSFFDDFVNGRVVYGDYFQHTKTGYESCNNPNVHLVVYEKMKANPKEETLKLAKFLGCEKALEANDGQLLDKVVQQSSFGAMKKHVQYESPKVKTVVNILRKGEAGGYKKSLTPSQIDTLKEKMEQEFVGTELLDLWRLV